MSNNVILVGRIEEIKENLIKIKTTRNFKNESGEYETDIIPCVINGHIASSVNEYCEKDDVVGIRGRLENKNNNLIVVADKITFLSSKNRNEEE